ncbi:MAG: 50S ribosomal protein L21 [Coriobacteriales bacterium]|nr:50S ribosomal protein L21 [Coriobacteriales bacterium]
MYAVVATGGKQVKVAKDDVVVVEKLDTPVGESVTFDVIFLADEDSIVVDPAELASAKVTGEVVEHFRGEKAVVFKFKKRKGYQRLKGHRQELTKVKITDVTAKAKKAAAKKAPAKKKEDAEPVAEATEATE